MRLGPAGVAVASALLLLAGCSTPPPGEARIDVDTPELRLAKDRAGVEPCPEVEAAPVDGGLPDVTLPCFGGGPDVPVSGLRGPMVVNLWASWCGPCRKEMPVLQDFHERYGDEVPIVGIDWQDSQTAGAMDLVADTGVTYPLLADPQNLLEGAGPFRSIGLPTTAYVAQDGSVTLVAGEIESLDELRELVDEHLGVDL